MDVKSGAKENRSVKNFGRILFLSSLCTFVRILSRYHVWNFFFKKLSIPRLMFCGSQIEILKPVCSVGFHPVTLWLQCCCPGEPPLQPRSTHVPAGCSEAGDLPMPDAQATELKLFLAQPRTHHVCRQTYY